MFSQEQRVYGVSRYLIYLPLCHKLKFPALMSLPSTRLYIPPQLTFSVWIFTGISKTDLLMSCIFLHAPHPVPYFLFSYHHANRSCLLWSSSYDMQRQSILPISLGPRAAPCTGGHWKSSGLCALNQARGRGRCVSSYGICFRSQMRNTRDKISN